MLNNYNIVSVSDNFYDYFAQVYLCEWSNVFLNYSFMLYKKNLTSLPMFKYMNYGLVSSYFFLRIYNFTSIEYKLVKENSYIIASLMSPIIILNYYWFYKIVKKAYIFQIKKN